MYNICLIFVKYCFQYLFSISLIFVIMDICHLWQTTQWECLPRTLVRVVLIFFLLLFHHLPSFWSFLQSLSPFHGDSLFTQPHKILSNLCHIFRLASCILLFLRKTFPFMLQGNAKIEWKANFKFWHKYEKSMKPKAYKSIYFTLML